VVSFTTQTNEVSIMRISEDSKFKTARNLIGSALFGFGLWFTATAPIYIV